MLQPFKALQPFNKSNLPFNLSVAQNKTAYLEQQIAAIYRDTEGVWYDPSDINRYMATGPDLVVNGDFSNGTTGWTQVLGTQSEVNGRIRLTANGTNPGRSQQAITCTGFISWHHSYRVQKTPHQHHLHRNQNY